MTTGTDAVEEATSTVDARPSAGGLASAARMLPAVLFVVVAAVGTAAAQGGYFSTSWGWSTVAFVLGLEAWLILSGQTDAGRADIAFLALFGAFAAWVALSIIWSTNPAQSVQDTERVVVLLAGVAAFVVLVRRTLVGQIAAVLVAGITVVSGYGLATRLFPQHLGSYDPVAVYRLSEPVGYWNGLGLFCGMGILLALGIAAHEETSLSGRVVAGIALVVLPVTLYFTFSRGAVAATAIGLTITAVVSDRRLRLAATLLATGPVAFAAVLLASRSKALTHQHASVAAVTGDGRTLAVEILALTLLHIAVVVGLGIGVRRLDVSQTARRVAGGAVVVGLAVILAAGVAHVGNPVTKVRSAYDSFVAPAPADDPVDLNNRFASFGGNGRIDVWRYAWQEARTHPLLGTGAGSFERDWQQNPNPPFKVRDAHALYLETLTELGPVGLVLLMAALLLPVGIGLTVRRQNLVPFFLGAYAAFLAHAGIDWIWELGGVSLTALLIGVLLLTSRRDRVQPVRDRVRAPAILVTMAIGVAALLGLLGNAALSKAQTADSENRYADAQVAARNARTLTPWSARPWIVLGQAQYASGDTREALTSFRRAVQLDDGEWSAWIGLAVAARGRERQLALDRARALYPGSADRKRIEEELANRLGR